MHHWIGSDTALIQDELVYDLKFSWWTAGWATLQYCIYLLFRSTLLKNESILNCLHVDLGVSAANWQSHTNVEMFATVASG